MTSRTRIVSGMRPTGPLHLGHYFGVLVNWIELQKDHDCFYFVADWHALTSEYADPHKVKGFVPELVKDYLAAGLDPEKCVIFQQSQVKEHIELHLILSMITPLGWLERNPTFKEQKEQISSKDLNTYGFFGYPVLQAADILAYRPAAVPVGQDQLPHLELTREIARRFNYLYGDYFPEPQAKLTPSPKLPGLDGRKMSKSYGNSITLGEEMDDLRPKIQNMLTDPKRARRKDPGDPATCNLFPYHQLLSSSQTCEEITHGCTTASIGCFDCKKMLVDALDCFLQPMRERRRALEADPERLRAILEDGNRKARAEAEQTMADVRKRLNFDF